MSISTALSNALSGLNVSSRNAEIISNNVANAMTPGYTRRTTEISSVVVAGDGAGARVSGIRLEQNPGLTADRRRIDAELGASTTRSDTLARVADALGAPGSTGALAARAAQLETAMVAASNDPASTSKQASLLDAAQSLTSTISQISTENRRIRMDADKSIARQVSQVNSALQDISTLNREIQVRSVSGGDTSALIDQRNQLLDQISSILPIKTTQRANDGIAIFTKNGATLLDGRVNELEFTPAGTITPGMTIGNGLLSGISINGTPQTIGTGTNSGSLDGGSLSALFETRDVTVPEFDDRLDALATDLIERFQDPSVDPSLGAGDAGLFTDGGVAFSTANQAGIAERIAVNAAVDPNQGGALWRLRDGINAATPGVVGSSTLIVAMSDALTGTRSAPLSFETSAAMSFAGFATELTTQQATASQLADDRLSFNTAYSASLKEAESAASGVDTDRELQQLLLVEQAYAANARVMSVADSMIRSLLEL